MNRLHAPQGLLYARRNGRLCVFLDGRFVRNFTLFGITVAALFFGTGIAKWIIG
jgi:hypothetical protein